MPIYEFYCPENNTLYQFLARSLAYHDAVPSCPDGLGLVMERRVSSFALIGRAREELLNDPFEGVDDAHVLSLMAEIESGMDTVMESGRADPRQVGHFRFGKLTRMIGDKAAPELREVVRRLESGEDPEKLDADYGHLTEAEASAAFIRQVKKIMRGRGQPVRDPKLYELREWLP